MTDTYDTLVRIGGMEVDDLEVTRDGCTLCDACQEDAVCDDPCGTCDACESLCEDCDAFVSASLPDLPPGPAELVLRNRFGESAPITVDVLDGDTGALR